MEIEKLLQQFSSGPYLSFKVQSGSQSLSLRRNAAIRRSVPQSSAPASPTETLPVSELQGIFASRVGVFYPKVSPGQKIEAGSVIGHIRAMNIMHEQKASASGTVKALMVEAGSGVQYGEPLIELEPAL